jgi:hypothetical protein
MTGIYKAEGEECLLRSLTVDAVAWFAQTCDFEHFGEEKAYPGEIVVEVMVALGRLKDRRKEEEGVRRWGESEYRPLAKPLPSSLPFRTSSLQPEASRGIVMKSSTASNTGPRRKSVSFDGVRDVFAENECVYHGVSKGLGEQNLYIWEAVSRDDS